MQVGAGGRGGSHLAAALPPRRPAASAPDPASAAPAPPPHDPYVIEEPSDEEPGQSSSEDEVDVLLHGTPDQKRKLIRECLTGESESSSEDEFQKEMEAELDCTMKTMEGKWKALEAGTPTSTGSAGTATTSKYYDDIYFDSDSEDEDKVVTEVARKRRRHQQRRIPTNDELLYDPEEDNRDQEWVDSQRRGYHNQRRGQQQQLQSQAIPNSDAVLNCPACLITLCLDCQRHESYKTQYRAMFVMNCSVNKEEILKYKAPVNRRIKRRNKKMKQSNETTSVQGDEEKEEIYHPVRCNECSTEVAVMDKDEVFHFFNVLASHC
ncbi:E2F-associated phosphoprotein [Alligator sinensis]|uniref:E2F-associated phosphoprotein n=1 Tax=Alligator sinensis TaxID=38654 RepID=A0A1U8CZG4_ALLSI|nr:E2F-associated phosphoprotein [Alligator sinensis]